MSLTLRLLRFKTHTHTHTHTRTDAFDREYKRAYDALTMSELDMFKREDRLPSQHACACRRQFSSLDLYK